MIWNLWNFWCTSIDIHTNSKFWSSSNKRHRNTGHPWYMPNTVVYANKSDSFRPVMNENHLVYFFHTELYETYIVLKTFSLWILEAVNNYNKVQNCLMATSKHSLNFICWFTWDITILQQINTKQNNNNKKTQNMAIEAFLSTIQALMKTTQHVGISYNVIGI